METILLSIKPEYVNAILDGTKLFEYRKRIPRHKVDRIIIYSTSPIMAVVGEVRVLDVITACPNPLWEKTKAHAGISRIKYREYFKGCKTAYAFQLGEVIKFSKPKTLIDYGITSAPQSFVCLDSRLCGRFTEAE